MSQPCSCLQPSKELCMEHEGKHADGGCQSHESLLSSSASRIMELCLRVGHHEHGVRNHILQITINTALQTGELKGCFACDLVDRQGATISQLFGLSEHFVLLPCLARDRGLSSLMRLHLARGSGQTCNREP